MDKEYAEIAEEAKESTMKVTLAKGTLSSMGGQGEHNEGVPNIVRASPFGSNNHRSTMKSIAL